MHCVLLWGPGRGALTEWGRLERLDQGYGPQTLGCQCTNVETNAMGSSQLSDY